MNTIRECIDAYLLHLRVRVDAGDLTSARLDLAKRYLAGQGRRCEMSFNAIILDHFLRRRDVIERARQFWADWPKANERTCHFATWLNEDFEAEVLPWHGEEGRLMNALFRAVCERVNWCRVAEALLNRVRPRLPSSYLTGFSINWAPTSPG